MSTVTKEKKQKLTLVVPAYNEEEALPIFYQEAQRVEAQMPQVEIEYLFIDDGSKDGTMEVLHSLNEKDPRVHYVSFSRNFGKEAAIYAGLENAAGDYVAILDADLQDPPALLPQMLQIVTEEEYDCVGSRRVTRKGEPPIRSFFARMFYRLMNKISSAEIVDGARDFQLMNRKVVNAILSMGEYNRFSKGIFGWVGFKKKWLEYENIERAAGETKLVFLEADAVCVGWDCCIFHRTSGICIGHGDAVLCAGVCGNYFYYHKNAGVWGSYFRMAVHGLHYYAGQRHTASLYRYFGSIYGKDISGNKTQAIISCGGRKTG